jgi:transcriptional regulator with XRE-family HTH domain
MAFEISYLHVSRMLGDRIRAEIVRRREAKGWSRPQLGARLTPPTSGQQIERLEKGMRQLDTEWLEKLAIALGADPAELVAGEQQRYELTQQVANEVALEMARFVLRGGEPDQETVEGLAILIQGLSATFEDDPQARLDAQVARPVVRALARQLSRPS